MPRVVAWPAGIPPGDDHNWRGTVEPGAPWKDRKQLPESDDTDVTSVWRRCVDIARSGDAVAAGKPCDSVTCDGEPFRSDRGDGFCAIGASEHETFKVSLSVVRM